MNEGKSARRRTESGGKKGKKIREEHRKHVKMVMGLLGGILTQARQKVEGRSSATNSISIEAHGEGKEAGLEVKEIDSR